MICKNLTYWVFTSGEEGIHGLDWGVKHASKSFPDRYKLDSCYRSLLKAFSLVPSLERPQKGMGLLLLPWQDRDEGTLMGFIFPGTDHKGRPNISTVACVVPSDVVRALSFSEVIRALWSSNDLERIAHRNSIRPDTLYFDKEKAPSSGTEVPLPLFPSLKWPGKDIGYLMIDEHVRELRCLYPPLCPPTEEADAKRKLRTPRLAALLMVLALAFGGACCWGSIHEFFLKLIQPVRSWFGGGKPSSSPTPPKNLKIIEKIAEREEIIKEIEETLKKEAFKGLAGLVWVSYPWNEGAFSFPSEGSAVAIIEEIRERFTARLRNEKWLVEKRDKGGKGRQKKLMNVSVLKDNFEKILLSHNKNFYSFTDGGNYFSKIVNMDDWNRVKNYFKNELTQELFKNTMQNADSESAIEMDTIAEDRPTLEKRLDELLKKSEDYTNEGHGYLSFFYGGGEEGYRVLTLSVDTKMVEESIFIKKSDNWRRINVSKLKERMNGSSKEKPCIKFDDDRRDITFFLVSQSRKMDNNFEEFLGVFWDDLLKSVSDK